MKYAQFFIVTGHGIQQGGGAVGGSVIDDQNFGNRVKAGLFANAADRRFNESTFIVAGHQAGDGGGHLGRYGVGNQACISTMHRRPGMLSRGRDLRYTIVFMGAENHPERAIILNCFGRGGSSILWNLIGSSPDVIMMNHEWHQAVFGERRRLRKGLTFLARKGWLPSGLVQSHALKSVLADRRPRDLEEKREAGAIVLKVMDYHISFNAMIEGSFPDAFYVVLGRHPFGQCESLMRSGLTLEKACAWYGDVAGMMAQRLQSGRALLVLFEDMIHDFGKVGNAVHDALNISWSEDGKFWFKPKGFGDERSGNFDASRKMEIRIGMEDVPARISPDVLSQFARRLSAPQRREIWARTRAAAQLLGYEETPPFFREPVAA